jgi:hypothetical protein
MSLLKLMSMVYEFLRLIGSFPDVAFDGTSKLIELLKVRTGSKHTVVQQSDLPVDPGR